MLKVLYLIFSLLLVGRSHLSAEILYSVTDLGTLGGSEAQGLAINNAGQVVGESNAHAFLYSNGGMQDLWTLVGNASVAHGINDAEQVVGWSLRSDSLHYGFLYTNGQTLDLGAGIALAINNAGQVAENVFLANILSNHAFIYTNGEKIDLGTLGGRNSQATAINNVGQVVGSSDTPLGGSHAFLYTNGQMLDLGTFGANRSNASAINDAGQVVINVDYGGYSRPFLLSNGQLIDLGSLGGASGSAYGINNAGQVVGTSETSLLLGLNHAFLYRDGGMSDLNNWIDPTLGIVLNSAVAINDHGQIVADSYSRGYLLTLLATTPVPAPSTLSLLGLALFGLAGSLSFRNRRLPAPSRCVLPNRHASRCSSRKQSSILRSWSHSRS